MHAAAEPLGDHKTRVQCRGRWPTARKQTIPSDVTPREEHAMGRREEGGRRKGNICNESITQWTDSCSLCNRLLVRQKIDFTIALPLQGLCILVPFCVTALYTAAIHASASSSTDHLFTETFPFKMV